MAKQKKKETEHRCHECANCTPVTRFHTLSVNGTPTLGTCPEWTMSRCVLMSQPACDKFKQKQ